EFREYERAATIVVNAYLAPRVGEYIQRLESSIQGESAGALYVMQSSGGIISARVAAAEPVRTVLSGPAGGVIGGAKVARPAWFDRGGVLHVGPASAGADPGPICYGRGQQATVTDANLILGRLDPELPLAGTVRLDELRTRDFMNRARGPIASVEQFAAGIVQLAEAEMEKAIRLISVERGHDPREFTLVCFGGAGPLHACALARSLGIPRVLVPSMPGALSALGILGADVVRDYSRTVMTSTDDSLLEKHFFELESTGYA